LKKNKLKEMEIELNKKEKTIVGILFGIVIVNFFLQYRAFKKMEQFKKSMIKK